MITIGYDIGSSSIKASLFDAASGKEITSTYHPKEEMKIDSPNSGWAEQDPENWWQSLKSATDEIFSNTSIKASEVKAIGISYQMHGLVIVDENRKCLRPSIIWCDSRAIETGDKAFEKIGMEKCLGSLLNSPGNFTASKLGWIKQNEPEVFKKIYKAMFPGDFIAMKLTGDIFTTISGLSEGIFWDFSNETISEDILDFYQFNKSLLPQIVPTFGIQGKTNKNTEKETGIKEGTPITYRAGDQPNNAFSLNVFNPGEVASTAGTSGVVYGITDKLQSDKLNRINTFAHVNHNKNERRLGVLLCINGTGISYSWIRKIIFNSSVTYSEMNKLAEEKNIGSNGLVFLPFGNGAERMLQNKNVGASFSGLDLNINERGHIARAVLEGVAFSFVYGLEIMKSLNLKPKVIRAGKANMFLSRPFRETISTLAETEIQLFNTNGSLGAARAAAFGAGHYSSFQETFADLKSLETINPDEKNLSLYEKAYSKWKNELEIKLSKGLK
jgi:xylulokinase